MIDHADGCQVAYTICDCKTEERLTGLVADLLYIADHKADHSTEAGRWWAQVIRSTVENHVGPQPPAPAALQAAQ